MQRVYRTPGRAQAFVWVFFMFLCCFLSSIIYTQLYSKRTEVSSMGDGCHKLSFLRIKLPLTVLASFHGSGSIFLRHLLHRLTGIATGSEYESDEEMLTHRLPGEGRNDGSVIVINTHSSFTRPQKYNKALLLIRNPFEALLAEFRRVSTYERVGHHPLEMFVTGWNDFFDIQIKVYRDVYISWTKHPNVLPIFHDNLRSDLKQSLLEISSFINATGVKLNMKCCLLDPDVGLYQKQSQVLPSDYFYSKLQIDKINETIKELHKIFSIRFKNMKLHNMKSWIMK